jgi:type VI secretion system protein ImpC
MAIQFKQLDDFLPDHLYRNLPLFQALRETRARLNNPATFAAAAAELGFAGAPQQTGDDAPAEGSPSAFESLLGGKVNRPTGNDSNSNPSPSNKIDALIKSIVAPHIVAGPDPMQAPCLAAVDAAISEQMRSILHHPDFQALESAWRGVQFLITNLELDENLQLHLIDISKAELAADIDAADGDLERCAIHQVLVEKQRLSPDAAQWSLLMGNYHFGNGSADVRLLASLGALAQQADAPFIAGADGSIVGCTSLAAEPDARNWPAPDGESATRWHALRSTAQAQWLCLAAPRLLLRLPYGAKTDQVEQFDFEECPALPVHAHYLWGNAAFACALVVGREFSNDGWDMRLNGAHDIGELPAHTYRLDGEAHMQPCAEINLSERSGDVLFKAGLIALYSHKHRNAVQVPALASLGLISSTLNGAWGGE